MCRIVDPQNVWRQHRVDELGLLLDAADYYRELYRAALQAKRSVLLMGWQFDSDVELLRGPEALAAEAPVTLLRFLSWLCETRPELHVCVLAWDYSPVFVAEREWLQELVFQWTTHPRVSFRFDSNHVKLGSLHQKLVVIDDDVSFTGGLDVCDHRWDDRRHALDNPNRMSRGARHQPYHDVQVYVRSREVAASFRELFERRWLLAGGRALPAGPPLESQFQPQSALSVEASSVAISRTDPFALPDGRRPCTEILGLYRRAIAGAERCIYAETQYLSSRAITAALEERLRDTRRSKLQLTFILNARGKTLREQAAVGLAQAQNVERLRRVGAQTGHDVGLLYTLPHCDADAAQPERGTYIHSKLMLVDDRFLTVGSANLTNRSMGVDTELNLSVETDDEDSALGRSLRRVRQVLLDHHGGGEGRLREVPDPTEGERLVLSLIDPDKLPFDPAHVEVADARQPLMKALSRAWRQLLSAAR